MSKKNIPSLVLYVIAGSLTIYTVWAFIHSAGVISDAISNGQITIGDNLYDIISFYMNNCAQYFLFALWLGAAGLLLQRNSLSAKNEDNAASTASGVADDDELDDFFYDIGRTEDEQTKCECDKQ